MVLRATPVWIALSAIALAACEAPLHPPNITGHGGALPEGSLDQFTLTSVSADSPPAVHGRLKATLAEQNAGPGMVTLDVAF